MGGSRGFIFWSCASDRHGCFLKMLPCTDNSRFHDAGGLQGGKEALAQGCLETRWWVELDQVWTEEEATTATSSGRRWIAQETPQARKVPTQQLSHCQNMKPFSVTSETVSLQFFTGRASPLSNTITHHKQKPTKDTLADLCLYNVAMIPASSLICTLLPPETSSSLQWYF